MRDALIRGRYSVGAEVGRGKFGVVYRGANERTGEVVALKFEQVGGSGGTLRHEATVLAHLARRGVEGAPGVRWFGPAVDPAAGAGAPASLCLVSTFFALSLDAHLDAASDRCAALCALMRSMICILQGIHAEFVVHRDVKPDNIRVHAGEPRLVDFGLAAVFVDGGGAHIPERARGGGAPIGTPTYMSPAVHLGAAPSRRDDLVSLGYVFMWCADGALPWKRAGVERGKARGLELAALKAPAALAARGARCDRVLEYLSECTALAHAADPDYAGLDALFSSPLDTVKNKIDGN